MYNDRTRIAARVAAIKRVDFNSLDGRLLLASLLRSRNIALIDPPIPELINSI